MEIVNDNKESEGVEITFRQFPIYNSQGKRFDPVELDDGQVIDWAKLPRPARRRIQKANPEIYERILNQRDKFVKPIEVHVYKCCKCYTTINAFILDKGKTPEMMPCTNCSYPGTEKKFTTGVAEGFTPSMEAHVYFRNCTEIEFDAMDELGKKYICEGGLFIEKAQ